MNGKFFNLNSIEFSLPLWAFGPAAAAAVSGVAN